MDGSVKIVIRKENGQQHLLDGWTNSMPWFCNNIKFLTKDEKHIDSYIKQNDHSDVFAPDGYGLVVFDLMGNKIYTNQNYCLFGDIHKAGLSMSANRNIMGETEEDSEFNNIIQLLNAGRISAVEGINPKVEIPFESKAKGHLHACSTKDWLSHNNIKFNDSGKLTTDGLSRLKEILFAYPMRTDDEVDRVFKEPYFFQIDMSPFDVINFVYKDHGFYVIFDALRQGGFEFTEKDLEAWEQWFNDYNE